MLPYTDLNWGNTPNKNTPSNLLGVNSLNKQLLSNGHSVIKVKLRGLIINERCDMTYAPYYCTELEL
jgi:hypothetical protein